MTEDVGRVLRAVPQIIELYQASKKVDGTRVIRLKMALEADGFHVGHSGDFTEALSNLAVSAGDALSDITGISAEIRRLEQAASDGPAAAIGRAKNLVEATAKGGSDPSWPAG